MTKEKRVSLLPKGRIPLYSKGMRLVSKQKGSQVPVKIHRIGRFGGICHQGTEVGKRPTHGVELLN